MPIWRVKQQCTVKKNPGIFNYLGEILRKKYNLVVFFLYCVPFWELLDTKNSRAISFTYELNQSWLVGETYLRQKDESFQLWLLIFTKEGSSEYEVEMARRRELGVDSTCSPVCFASRPLKCSERKRTCLFLPSYIIARRESNSYR